MIVCVGPGAGADAAAGRVARLGAGGVVSRARLFGRLGASARVTVVSAPPGSGKTVLLRSWIGEAGLSGRAAWVPVGRGERDPQQFRLLVARHRGDLPAVADEVRRLEAMAEAPDAAQYDPAQYDLASATRAIKGAGEVRKIYVTEELRALALDNLGSAEVWTTGVEEAQRHLEQGVALARRIGRPYLEFTGLAYLAVEIYRSFARAAERSRQAIELAQWHGWTDEPAVGTAYWALGAVLTWQGRPEEAEAWIQRAERAVTADAEPAARLAVHYSRGRLELIRGRDADALAAFRAAERLAGRLAAPNLFVARARAMVLYVLVRLGDTEQVEQALAGLGQHDRHRAEILIITAALRLAQDDPGATAAPLAPVLDGSVSVLSWGWLALAFLLEAIARDALGEPAAAGQALERALDLAEPDGGIELFLLHPMPGLLERHARQRTAHAALIGEILSLLAGQRSAPPAGPRPPLEALSSSEMRVLRYLPTNLTGPEIASALYVSHNTVRSHLRHLYAKLGTHRRADTVARARALGLLAPSSRT